MPVWPGPPVARNGADLPDCGDLGISIAFDGTWHYHHSPISRMPLVKLFASVLRFEPDNGHYWLVTPAERGRVAVEDVPFIGVAVMTSGRGRDAMIRIRSNLDHEVALDQDHPLVLRRCAYLDALVPYVHVRDGLWARLSRSVWLDLVETALHDTTDPLGVFSNGQFFPLEDHATGP